MTDQKKAPAPPAAKSDEELTDVSPSTAPSGLGRSDAPRDGRTQPSAADVAAESAKTVE